MRKFGYPSPSVRLLAHAAVFAVAIAMVLPFGWMVVTSLKTDVEALRPPAWGDLLPSRPAWSNYSRAVREAELGEFYTNSIVVAVVTTVLGVFHNALAGYAFARMRFLGKRALFALVLATMMLPVQCFVIFAYIVAGRLGLTNSLPALIVPFLASGFGIYFMRQAVQAVPDSLLESGQIDGMGDFELFWTVVRPAAWPAISALGILTFMNSWNAFFWPLIAIDSLEKKTLPLAIADLSAGIYIQSWPVQMAAATIMTAPLVVVFVLAQRAFVRGMTAGGVKE